MIRSPAVAGTFYPKDRAELVAKLGEFTVPHGNLTRAIGIVVPHAGYVYSGHVAGAVYSRLQLPNRFIVLCPNHTGLGRSLAIMSEGEWRTPIGNVPVDRELAVRLLESDPDLEEDVEAHQREHAQEVQLPFLQHLAGAGIRFVPITVGTSDFGTLGRLGKAIARVLEGFPDEVLIVASSDMNHYDTDSTTRIKDRIAIDRVLALDPEGLYQIVLTQKVSMCGFGPATSMLVAAKWLGATRADLVRYATSGDIFGERDRVVGYAGMIVRQ